MDAQKLEALKEHLRYEFALQLDNSEAIAETVAQYVALRRTPETINRYYDDVREADSRGYSESGAKVSDR